MSEYYRKKYVDELLLLKDKKYIKVLTGIRRSGKSTILKQFKNKISDDFQIEESRIFEYNFNKPKFEKYTYMQLYNEIIEKADKDEINYVFLDEIQEIKEWEKCVIGLYEEDKIRFDIYITGSNSKMLSSELSTLLTGRHRDIHVMPLSFKEFNEITKEKNFIKDFYKYAELGGLGIIIQNINEPNEAKKDLAMVLKDTIKKDVRKKHHNSSSILIDKTIKYALSNIGISISSHKIADKINKSENKKISHLPFFNYLKWGCDAMILYRIDYYNNKTNTILTTSGKYYAGDLGLLNSVVGYSENTLGYKLENIVLLQLISLGWDVYTLKMYQKKKDDKEVDFVIRKGSVIKYIQVTHTLTDKNKGREVGNLISIKDGHEKIIILISDESSYSNDGIRRIDLIRWLNEEIVI